jgi:hypothetical protein
MRSHRGQSMRRSSASFNKRERKRGSDWRKKSAQG